MKKLLLIIISSLFLVNSLLLPGMAKAAPPASPTPAPSVWYNTSFRDWYGKVYDPNNPSEIFGERYTAAQVQWVIYGIWGFLINSATGPQNAAIVQCFLKGPTDITTCLSQFNDLVAERDASKASLAYVDPATDKKTNVWASVFATNRPISGIAYVRDAVQNFSIVPVARAQGFGFETALNPIQMTWSIFRNIAFGLFVLVAVVFAFMIMFRVKLSPQTVISVQSALPKIIISIILVTFSYAIAGFLIDLMYVVIGLLSVAADAIFKAAVFRISIGPSHFFKFLTLGQPIGLNIQIGILGDMSIILMIFILPFFVCLEIVGVALLGIPPPFGEPLFVLYEIFMAILTVIVVIMFIWFAFKVAWSLLKAFVNIILLTIFAPIQIALGTVVPSLGFGQWMRSYVSNLAVFVVTGALFLFSFMFIVIGISIGLYQLGAGEAKVVDAILSPFLGNIHPSFNLYGSLTAGSAWPPLLGGGSGPLVGLLFLGVAFVLFTLMPKAAEIVQGLLSGKPFAYGSAVGEFLGTGAAVGGFAYKNTIGPGVNDLRKYNSGMLTAGIFTGINSYLAAHPALNNKLPKNTQDFINQSAIRPGDTGSKYGGHS